MKEKRKRKRTSIIWVLPKEDFEKVVKSSSSIADILKHFGYAITGSAHQMIKTRCLEEGIDFSHIRLGTGSNKGRSMPSKIALPLNEVMVEHSTYHRGHLKKRLIKDGILENKCSKCGLPAEWDGQTLVMVLDHINGVRDDHRKENLRLLCPNCNSQTSTFSGRNPVKKKHLCSMCGKKVSTYSKHCAKCLGKILSERAIKTKNRPDKETLQKEITTVSFTVVAKKYGVSDNTIRKWCKRYGIDTKIYGRGYWQKRLRAKYKMTQPLEEGA